MRGFYDPFDPWGRTLRRGPRRVVPIPAPQPAPARAAPAVRRADERSAERRSVPVRQVEAEPWREPPHKEERPQPRKDLREDRGVVERAVSEARSIVTPSSGEPDEVSTSAPATPIHGRTLLDPRAEIEAAKHRIEKQAARELERAKDAIILDWLEVLDDLERALAAAPNPDDPMVRGVELTRSRFLDKLAKHGVERMNSETIFDPERHEALGTMPTRDPSGDGAVAAIVRPGYLRGDTVIRPAGVIVGKHG